MDTPALIVFDLVGTIVQGSELLPTALRRAFETVGVNLSDDDIAAARGKSKREAISSMLFESVGAKKAGKYAMNVYEAFENAMLQQYWDSTIHEIDGTRDVFDWCDDQRTKKAIATGFDRRLVNVLIDKLGWADDIDAIVCNDEVKRGRPAPYLIFHAMEKTGVDAVSAVATIGDTVADLQAGNNAGVGWNIGVLSGDTSEEELEAEPHTALIDSVADLPGLFAGDLD
jgi:phosphonatase-like hydrolase